MKLLSLETSCDETAAAVTEDGVRVLSNVVASQAAFHAKYGGVVPEIAGRLHIERINHVVREALAKAGVGPDDIDAVAVANTPGLIGCLLVGVTAAKTLAWAWGKPLIDVNHIHGHIYSCCLEQPAPVRFPAVALIVSGGHTALYRCDDELRHTRLGSTIDDAAGEAFDKVAAILGLGYPGGPEIDRVARGGDPRAFDFPRSLPQQESLDFSFSGLKTAVLYTVRGQPGVHRRDAKHAPGPAASPGDAGSLSAPGPTFVFAGEAPAATAALDEKRKADIAASFQQAVVDVLVRKTLRAAERVGAGSILCGGGVAANSALRSALTAAAERGGRTVHFAPRSLCTDNAAMMAVAYHKFRRGQFAGLDLQAMA
jgi:N6-L-threonylcarbamoyladenine synthase